ncbi:MAG TPA: hypothetical protein VLA09_01250, partial [Longimicrobiales bacterium]|nr:hypothetical protein [Longimicrobiales bacterium]
MMVLSNTDIRHIFDRSTNIKPTASIGKPIAVTNGIERLVRYCARPSFALERLRALDATPALVSAESRL